MKMQELFEKVQARYIAELSEGLENRIGVRSNSVLMTDQLKIVIETLKQAKTFGDLYREATPACFVVAIMKSLDVEMTADEEYYLHEEIS